MPLVQGPVDPHQQYRRFDEEIPSRVNTTASATGIDKPREQQRQPAGLETGATTLARRTNRGIQAARGLEDEFFSLLVNRMA